MSQRMEEWSAIEDTHLKLDMTHSNDQDYVISIYVTTTSIIVNLLIAPWTQ